MRRYSFIGFVQVALFLTAMASLGAAIAVLTTKPAKSQTAPNAETQALSNKLVAELQSNLQCSTGLITANARIAELEKRVKELEPKTAETK